MNSLGDSSNEPVSASDSTDAMDESQPREQSRGDALLRMSAANMAAKLAGPVGQDDQPQGGESRNSGDNPFSGAAPAPPTWQFGVTSLLLTTFVFAVIMAVAAQLLRMVRQGTTVRAAYAMFTLMAPVILVTVVSFARSFAIWFRKR